eukprot:scaffold194210_cov27-Tisochrysis_lutea.AAC.2
MFGVLQCELHLAGVSCTPTPRLSAGASLVAIRLMGMLAYVYNVIQMPSMAHIFRAVASAFG